jgi:hypothetical protein
MNINHFVGEVNPAAANSAVLGHSTPDIGTVLNFPIEKSDARLIANGYEPVATEGKIPRGTGWQNRPNAIDAIATERTVHPEATNTGLRTGRLAGVDNDLHEQEHAAQVNALTRKRLGDTIERIGSKGSMLCYRNESPVSKITISGTYSGRQERVEILGTGQQFVAYGIHPDTGKPFNWTDADIGINADPLTVPFKELPEVTPTALREFAKEVAALLDDLGYTDIKVSGLTVAEPRKVANTPVDFTEDTPAKLAIGRKHIDRLIAKGFVPTANNRNTPCFQVAAMLRDFGLSEEATCAEVERWCEAGDGPPEDQPLADIVNSAYRGNAQNARGSKTTEAIWAIFLENVRLANPTALTDAELANDDGLANEVAPSDKDLFLSDDDLAAVKPGAVVDLIPGYVEKHRVAYISGIGGISKSRIGQHWGYVCQTGGDLFGQQIEKATFFHVSYENGKEEDARRRDMIVEAMKLAPGALAGMIYCDFQGQGPLLVIDEGPQSTALWERLETKLRSATGHKFIVFDSLYDVCEFVGNAKISENAVKRTVSWLDLKMRELDASGLMILHPSRAGANTPENSGWSVAWDNAPRLRLAIKPADGMDGCIELTVPKRNNAAKPTSRVLHWANGLMLPDNDAGQNHAVYEACIDVATAACNGGTPITRGPTGNYRQPVYLTAIAEACGVKINAKKFLEQLARACLHERLIYRQYDDNKHGEDRRAGFFPTGKITF